MATKCEGEGCTNKRAWAFRARRMGSPYLCDECWGHKYGDQTCQICELGCYDEDVNDDGETYTCGRCVREREE